MNIYKMVFVNNEVISCEITTSAVLDGAYHYVHNCGKLIYAIVKAENEEEARKMSIQLIGEVHEKHPVKEL